jgi:hypothetical protein
MKGMMSSNYSGAVQGLAKLLLVRLLYVVLVRLVKSRQYLLMMFQFLQARNCMHDTSLRHPLLLAVGLSI